MSSPELTALDLFYYQDNFGINKIVGILNELAEELKVPTLIRIAKNYPQTASIQRLGYLLDKELGNAKLSEPLLKILNERKHSTVALSIDKNRKEITKKYYLSSIVY